MKNKSRLLGCLKENKKVVNKKRRHPELDSGSHLVSVLESGEIPYQVRNDNFIFKGVGPVLRPYGAPLRSGFTLIELLVVVLIIGILAAVAVPQYQKAVWKSRFAQAKTLAHSLAEAEEIYYMANGKYTYDFEELAVSLSATSFSTTSPHRAYFNWGWCSLYSNSSGRAEVACTLTKNDTGFLRYWIGLQHSTHIPAKTKCLAIGTTGQPTAGDINYQICKSDTADPYPASWGDTTYGWNY